MPKARNLLTALDHLADVLQVPKEKRGPQYEGVFEFAGKSVAWEVKKDESL